MERKPITTTKTNGLISYSSTVTNIPLEVLSLKDRIDYMAENYPNKVVYIFHMNNGLQLTYSDVKQRSYTLANNLMSLGLNKGDRIAYLLPNTYELLICYFAASIAGLISVPLDADYGSDELEYMLKKTEPSAVVFYDCAEYEKMVNDLFSEIYSSEFKSKKFPNLRHVIAVEDHSSETTTKSKSIESAFVFSDLEKKLIDTKDKKYPYIDPDDVFAVMFTSGTTSRPKGISVRYSSLLNNINIYCKLLGASENEEENKQITSCITTLTYHIGAIFGFMMVMFSPRYRLVLPSYKFDLVEIMHAVQKYKCNNLSCLPKILSNLIDHPKRAAFDLSSLEYISVGGQLTCAELCRRVRDELGVRYFGVGFGMTEVNIVTYQLIDLDQFNFSEYGNCVGSPFPFIECKIVDPETGRIQPLGVEGELHVRGYNVTKSLWNDPEMTKKFIDQNGWLNTGDILTMNNEGRLYFRSRSKEIITAKGSGRLDVYPSIVESVLLNHPNIIEAIVFGIPVNIYEQELCAWVKLKSNKIKTSEEEIIEFCSQRLIDYQVPRFIKFVEDFPANKIGKYVRNEMSKRFRQELGI